MQMRPTTISSVATVMAILCATPPVKAQLAFENTHMGEDYKVYIYKKANIGSGRWRFQTKTVFRCGAAAMQGCKASPPNISDWQTADCDNSTIDGKTVPTVARFGYERGNTEVFKSVCRL